MKNKNIIRYLLFLSLNICLGTGNIFAQGTITVKGSIIDETKSPLIGVNVSSETPGVGTITDFDGNFTLQVKEGEVLTFSYIGYTTVKESATSIMNIQMNSDAVMMDAVTIVGIGYGTMRKSDLTGSITSVAADDLKQGVITSTEQMLQGKVAGLTVVQTSGDPTQGSKMRLRGGTSLSASNGPLIVVDGIPGVDMNTVQPNEILSIDVLKDASAAAIYGSRGANGVIIVTTNKQTDRRQITYNGYVAIGSAAKDLDLLSANQWRAYVRENNVTGAVDYGGDTDWQDELQRTAVSHSHNLSYSNGNENSGMRAAVSFQNTEGIIKRNSLSRLAGSVSGYQYGFNNRLKLETSIHANVDDWHPVNMEIYERAYNQNPTLPVKQNGAYTQIGGNNANNPVELLNNREDDQTRYRLLAYVKAELEIVDGLKAATNISYEYNSQQGRFFVPTYAFAGIAEKGVATRSLSDYRNMQIETYLTYDKSFNDIHRFNLMAGYSYLKNTYEGFGANRRGYDTNLFHYNNLGAGTDVRAGDVNSYKGESKLASFFGRVNYTLKDRYMFTGTLRRDGSSRFGDNHKWGLFPSASAAWRISEEAFMEGTRDWLDNLKLRVGFGITGNQDGIGEYRSLSLMGVTGAYYDLTTNSWKNSYGVTQNENKDLKWESTASYNIGVDFNFLRRFTVSIDAYYKKTSDLLYEYSVPQPPYLYPTMMANVGDLSNRGIELTLGAQIMETKDFSWSANLTLAYNKQKVDKLSNSDYQTDAVPFGNLHGIDGMSGVYTQILKEGEAVGTFYGPVCLGIDENGKYIYKTQNILNDEGEVVGEEIVNEILGNAQPKLNLGISMDFSYRDFDLNVAGYGMFGQKILNAQRMFLWDSSRLPSKNVPDEFLKSGINDTPKYSSYWIEKGDFFRLQSVTLGYTLPVKNDWFQKVRFYVTGENLFVITGYKGLDPEVNIDGLRSPGIDKSIGTAEHGDNYYYPRPRTFSLGVNLVF